MNNRSAFVTLLLVVVVLMVATLLEPLYGTSFVSEHIYGARWFIILWTHLFGFALWHLVRRRLYRRPVPFLMHLSLLVILTGALVTHLFGLQGSLHLRVGSQSSEFVDRSDSTRHRLPFAVTLHRFEVQMYPGTQSPMDYVSHVSYEDTASLVPSDEQTVSMNHIARYRGYRFYQSGYDPDAQGVVLLVSYDPWGISITYLGYALLCLSMLLYLLLPRSAWRRAFGRLREVPGLRLVLLLVLLSPLSSLQALSSQPKVLPETVAASFDDLYVYYNGRICPLQTLTHTFTTKLCGSPTYRGYSAAQVFTGWLFYPTDWLSQPIVKVKGEQVRRRLGIVGSYACYQDFYSPDGYVLESVLDSIRSGHSVEDARQFREAHEKVSLLSMLFSGRLLCLFPYADEASSTRFTWLSPGDNLPLDMPEDEWFFVKKSLDYMGELVMQRDYRQLEHLLEKIRLYQHKQAGEVLPPDFRFYSEQLYNTFNHTRPLSMLLTTLGIVFFFIYLPSWLRGCRPHRVLHVSALCVVGSCLLYVLFLIILRGFASGHLPMTNGHETMMLVSAVTLAVTLFVQHRFALIVPFGMLLGGLTLLVSMMGQSNPQLTPLMPVLASPLLSSHVCFIMTAYSLLAFVMFNGLTALMLPFFCRVSGRAEFYSRRLMYVSQTLLYPALFMLTAGIFIGAVWANISWGRYWGWDPKEVWALITMLIYSLPLHTVSLPAFRRPRVFHLYNTLAFLSVLMTYFGVNYVLGGMHSYA